MAGPPPLFEKVAEIVAARPGLSTGASAIVLPTLASARLAKNTGIGRLLEM